MLMLNQYKTINNLFYYFKKFWGVEIHCMFYNCSTAKFRQAAFQVLNNHTWQAVTLLDSITTSFPLFYSFLY